MNGTRLLCYAAVSIESKNVQERNRHLVIRLLVLALVYTPVELGSFYFSLAEYNG